MEIVNQKIVSTQEKSGSLALTDFLESIRQHFAASSKPLTAFAFTAGLDDYEKRKLTVFIQINFFQLITGFVVPLIGLQHTDRLPTSAWLIACLPACIPILVLCLLFLRFYHVALLIYFILYPLFTYVVYLQGMNAGTELNFILIGILSVFFLRDTGYMLFTVAFSMMNYFMIAFVLKRFNYQVETENHLLYLFNQFLSLAYIFYGLFLIKKENNDYQFHMLSKNYDLHQQTLKIEKQKEEIAEKAALLEVQKSGLSELNASKNRLFSIIAHYFKSPMYALSNHFNNINN